MLTALVVLIIIAVVLKDEQGHGKEAVFIMGYFLSFWQQTSTLLKWKVCCIYDFPPSREYRRFLSPESSMKAIPPESGSGVMIWEVCWGLLVVLVTGRKAE